MKRIIMRGVITAIILGGVFLYSQMNKPEKREVIGVVTGKKIQEATTQRVENKNKTKQNGKKSYTTKKIEAKYYVDIIYEDLKVKADDMGLYNRAKVGDEVKVILNEYYDKKGNLRTKSITYED